MTTYETVLVAAIYCCNLTVIFPLYLTLLLCLRNFPDQNFIHSLTQNIKSKHKFLILYCQKCPNSKDLNSLDIYDQLTLITD